MKRNSKFDGWSLRDLRQHRFAIPNAMWDYELKPIEFMIFSYLCYCRSNHLADTTSLDDIAKGIHVTTDTVKKYLSTLSR